MTAGFNCACGCAFELIDAYNAAPPNARVYWGKLRCNEPKYARCPKCGKAANNIMDGDSPPKKVLK